MHRLAAIQATGLCATFIVSATGLSDSLNALVVGTTDAFGSTTLALNRRRQSSSRDRNTPDDKMALPSLKT
jgi:hypothetical protein